PFYLVDAVVEVPFGSYPGNMAYEYFSDEEHLAQWLKVEKDPDEFQRFLDKYIYIMYQALKNTSNCAAVLKN
ncbi:MAG TPA: hypothetical protein VLP30_08405, partial [Desulfatirhabdiaceae bacterium]|nr:hypothetical protein [Desulfatirhabdiaceae bacterium]